LGPLFGQYGRRHRAIIITLLRVFDLLPKNPTFYTTELIMKKRRLICRLLQTGLAGLNPGVHVLGLCTGMNLMELGEQALVRVRVVLIGDDAVNRADGDALRLTIEAIAFGTKVRVNDVDGIAGADSLIRALGLASTAGNAGIDDLYGHGYFPLA
jgi:hypothetical protein